MQPLPHTYPVAAGAEAAGTVALTAQGAPQLLSAPPREFGGPGDQWSPESLLIAAVASCFILTFRAVARASRLEWTRLECTVEGVLERADGAMRFTRLVTKAKLTAPPTASAELCQRVLEKAEHGCLVTNSLSASRELQTELTRG
jgi:organic hydroperoxide reductase OsmC/OhrA